MTGENGKNGEEWLKNAWGEWMRIMTERMTGENYWVKWLIWMIDKNDLEEWLR